MRFIIFFFLSFSLSIGFGQVQDLAKLSSGTFQHFNTVTDTSGDVFGYMATFFKEKVEKKLYRFEYRGGNWSFGSFCGKLVL